MNFHQKKEEIGKLQVKIIDFISQECFKFEYKAMPIYYMLQKLNHDEYLIYRTIDYLLQQNILERINTSICPICGYENILREEYSKTKCRHCCEVYYDSSIQEKFRIIDEYEGVH